MFNKSAFGACNDPIPEFYVNRNAKLDPSQDAEWWGLELDMALQRVMAEAPASRCTVTQNMSPDQRRALKDLQARQGDMLIIRDDKVNGFVYMTRRQFLSTRARELSSANYTRLDQPPNLVTIVRKGQEILERYAEALGPDIVTYIKWGLSQNRVSRLNLQGKSHKGINVDAEIPIRVRAIVDTVGWPTTGAATVISKTLSPLLKLIPTHVQDTEHAITIIEGVALAQDEYMGVYDIGNFYPNCDRDNCRSAVAEKLAQRQTCPVFTEALLELEQFVTENVKFEVPKEPGQEGKVYYSMSAGYGIGLGHSREMCDICEDRMEQRMLAQRRALGKRLPRIFLRQVDDGFFTFNGTSEELEDFKADLCAMDPTRVLTFEISKLSVNWLDLTLFKGLRFRRTGVLDMKVYRKPTSKEMQLPRISHHPDATFKAILTGEAQRILRCTNNKADWLEVMNVYSVELRNRGYSAKELWDNFLNAIKFEDRGSLLTPRERPYKSVLALKLPFTERVKQTGAGALLRQSYEEAMAIPSLRETFGETRFVLALTRTRNLRDSLVSK